MRRWLVAIHFPEPGCMEWGFGESGVSSGASEHVECGHRSRRGCKTQQGAPAPTPEAAPADEAEQKEVAGRALGLISTSGDKARIHFRTSQEFLPWLRALEPGDRGWKDSRTHCPQVLSCTHTQLGPKALQCFN